MTSSALRKSETEQTSQRPDYAGLNNGAYVPRRLAGLVAEHDDLDLAIAALLASASCDDLLITRLKKRKLQLKDEIALMRGWVMPGVTAGLA